MKDKASSDSEDRASDEKTKDEAWSKGPPLGLFLIIVKVILIGRI